MQELNQQNNPRREFLGTVATGAALSLAAMASPLAAFAGADKNPNPGDADKWFDSINGKYRVVFDATQPHEMMPFAWPRVFLMTNQATGASEKDCSVVVVLRHNAIPYAFEDRLWEQYPLSDVFKAEDPITKAATKKNPFWKPEAGKYKIPGFGAVQIGINELQSSGVMFCVCNAAMTVYSAAIAQQMGKKGEDVLKDWTAGVLPGIQIVPSGVWALGRAQDHKCAYIFAG
jgi:intracellular sulfur oxidation DsrE/DsrF family protein